jgi:co-chaperonin GroES (HSP10)
MATGSNRFLQFVKQTAPRELPSPANFVRLRNTGGGGIANNRTNITSNEIRSDRQIIESRLGQNQPDITVPYELSFDSYDAFIQGALGGSWIGGYTIEAEAEVDTGGEFTLSSGTWADHPISEGDYVLVNGTSNTDIIGEVGDIDGADLTVYEIGTTTAITTTSETVDFTFVTGHYAEEIATSTNELSVVATAQTITRTNDSWIDLGVEIGDKIFFDGFSSGANNGWIEVEDVTDTVITARDGSLVDETIDTGTVSLVTSTGFLTVGNDLDFFAIEEGFTDIDSGDDVDGNAVTDGVFHHILGCYVSNWNMSIQPDSVLTGEFQFQGLVYSGFLNETSADGVEESNINNVFDSFTGNLSIPSAPDIEAVITGFDFTLDNGLTRRYALMDKNAISIGDGRSNVTGTLNAYFENADLSNIFEKEEEIQASIRTEDLDGNSYTFGIPKLKLTSESRDVSESDVTQTLNFQGLGGRSTDKKKTLYVLRQPAIA